MLAGQEQYPSFIIPFAYFPNQKQPALPLLHIGKNVFTEEGRFIRLLNSNGGLEKLCRHNESRKKNLESDFYHCPHWIFFPVYEHYSFIYLSAVL